MRQVFLAPTLLICVLAATLPAVSWSQAPAPPSNPPPASSGPQTVKGEVIMLTPELCVVKEPGGKSTLLSMGKDTVVSGGVKVGGKVEAQMTADGRAVSIKPIP